MEIRNVQLVGGSTYTVSLPKEWADEHDLAAGERLRLDPRADGSLLVRTDRLRGTGNRNERNREGGSRDEENRDGDDGGSDRRTARVSVDRTSRADVARTVRVLYGAGFDSFVLVTSEGFETGTRRVVSAAAESLIGLEVIRETDSHIELRSLLDAADVSIRRTVSRLGLVALSMQREATLALREGDVELAGHAVERGEDADRLFGLVDRSFQRALSESGAGRLGPDRRTLFEYYRTARNLRSVADRAERIGTVTTRLDGPLTTDHAEPTLAFERRSRAVVEDATDVVLDGEDREGAYETLAEHESLVADIEAFERTLHGGDVYDAYALGILVESLRRTAECGGDIATVAIQYASSTAGSTERRHPVSLD
jgi:phosphate uptake regulator